MTPSHRITRRLLSAKRLAYTDDQGSAPHAASHRHGGNNDVQHEYSAEYPFHRRRDFS